MPVTQIHFTDKPQGNDNNLSTLYMNDLTISQGARPDRYKSTQAS